MKLQPQRKDRLIAKERKPQCSVCQLYLNKNGREKTKNATVAVDIESPIRDVRKHNIFIVQMENNNLISSTQLSSHLRGA